MAGADFAKYESARWQLGRMGPLAFAGGPEDAIRRIVKFAFAGEPAASIGLLTQLAVQVYRLTKR